MCAKTSHKCCCIVAIAVGIHCANAGVPSGLREALAEFETGATRPAVCAGDYMIGSRQEISRFQILPAVWKQYSKSRDYHDPKAAWNVAVKILGEREKAFRKATQRDWDYADIYLMWNAPGLYERVKWDRTKVSRVVRQRAERFSNLMEERARIFAAQNVAQN
jgi:hypothetical protein